MNQRTRNILRYLFVVLLGVILHFAYELSGENLIVGLFSPVNESVWEHLKLLFFPMLLLTLWDLFTNYRSNPAFLPARTTGILAGMSFIAVLYYTITGIVGTPVDWINILIYFLSVAYVFWVERKICRRNQYLNTTISIAILIVLIILFIVFTLVPPALGIFVPPTA